MAEKSPKPLALGFSKAVGVPPQRAEQTVGCIYPLRWAWHFTPRAGVNHDSTPSRPWDWLCRSTSPVSYFMLHVG